MLELNIEIISCITVATKRKGERLIKVSTKRPNVANIASFFEKPGKKKIPLLDNTQGLSYLNIIKIYSYEYL